MRAGWTHRLHDIELDEAALLRVVARVAALDLVVVAVVDLADMAKPVVDETEPLAAHGEADAAAAVVPADDDVLDLEYLYSELHHRQAVQVAVHDDIGDVAVHENLARLQAHQHVRLA